MDQSHQEMSSNSELKLETVHQAPREDDDCSTMSAVSDITLDENEGGEAKKHQRRRVGRLARSAMSALKRSKKNKGEHHIPTEITKDSAHEEPAQERRRSVTFSEVKVRQYETIMYDYPAAENGPSVGIGWGYDNERTVSVDDWEENYRKHLTKDQLFLQVEERHKLMKDLGYSSLDITIQEFDGLKLQPKKLNRGPMNLGRGSALASRQPHIHRAQI